MQSSMNISNMFESHSNYKIGNIEETFRIILHRQFYQLTNKTLTWIELLWEGQQMVLMQFRLYNWKRCSSSTMRMFIRLVAKKCFPVVLCSYRKHWNGCSMSNGEFLVALYMKLSLCGSCFEMFLQFLQFQDHTVYRISRIYCLLL